MSIFKKLTKQGLINPPPFLVESVQYETLTGSVSYGVSGDTSDMDIIGYCIPDRGTVFPHTQGQIQGFGTPMPRFEQFEKHHVLSLDGRKNYDLTCYNVVKYFQLCMENNPNMVDSLYTPDACVLHISPVGRLVRDNRDLFLHKGSFQKFKGYAYAQMKKIRESSNPLTHFMHNHKLSPNLTIENIDAAIGDRSSVVATLSNLSHDELLQLKTLFDKYHLKENEKRRADIIKYGYSTKFAYHVVRLINESEQILTEHTLDLQRSREQLKSIRRGEWTLDQVEKYMKSKEAALEEMYLKSTLRYTPDEKAIKNLLFQILEIHFGNLDSLVSRTDRTPALVSDLEKVLALYR